VLSAWSEMYEIPRVYPIRQAYIMAVVGRVILDASVFVDYCQDVVGDLNDRRWAPCYPVIAVGRRLLGFGCIVAA